jgi:hypothetical protein
LPSSKKPREGSPSHLTRTSLGQPAGLFVWQIGARPQTKKIGRARGTRPSPSFSLRFLLPTPRRCGAARSCGVRMVCQASWSPPNLAFTNTPLARSASRTSPRPPRVPALPTNRVVQSWVSECILQRAVHARFRLDVGLLRRNQRRKRSCRIESNSQIFPSRPTFSLTRIEDGVFCPPGYDVSVNTAPTNGAIGRPLTPAFATSALLYRDSSYLIM